MSKKRKIILFVVLAVIIVVMMVYSMNKKSSKGIEVTVSEVERGDITKIVSGSGYIQPELDVDIAARISAEIIKIHIKEGDRVDRGQLIFIRNNWRLRRTSMPWKRRNCFLRVRSNRPKLI
jgi:HlyD family secretion protein